LEVGVAKGKSAALAAKTASGASEPRSLVWRQDHRRIGQIIIDLNLLLLAMKRRAEPPRCNCKLFLTVENVNKK
jgi:hypothetical protein